MKQRLNSFDIKHSYLKGKAITKGWSLCIGAGTSIPAFPNWYYLVKNLILKDKDINDEKQCNEILSTFSLDALIQASSLILDLSDEELQNYCLMNYI